MEGDALMTVEPLVHHGTLVGGIIIEDVDGRSRRGGKRGPSATDRGDQPAGQTANTLSRFPAMS